MELIKLENGIKITSNTVAELTMKRHSDVLETIRGIIENVGIDEVSGDLRSSTYKDRSNREKPNYTMTKDGLMLVITKYSDIHRLKLIKYCRELEKNKTPRTYIEALKETLRIAEENEVLMLERDIAIKTKAEISNKKTATAMNTASKFSKRNKKIGIELEGITNDTYLFTPTQASKSLGLNVRELNNILVDSEWIYINKNKEKSGKYHPTKITENRGIFKRMKDKYGTLRITEAGLEIIEDEIMIG